ncbi:MAG: hypothetical protein WC285_01860 [Candidatus Gracilibacteria bacterium]|jgi:hypothetical protein
MRPPAQPVLEGISFPDDANAETIADIAEGAAAAAREKTKLDE